MLNLNELAEMSRRFLELYNENDGLIDICSSYSRPSVHIRTEVFLDTFSVYDVKKVDEENVSLKYPYRISTKYLGVEFFALMTQKQYEMEFEDSKEAEEDAEEL